MVSFNRIQYTWELECPRIAVFIIQTDQHNKEENLPHISTPSIRPGWSDQIHR